MTTPVICRQYRDGEIAIMFPDDTVNGMTVTLFMRQVEPGYYMTHYEDVDYLAVIAQTRPLAKEAAEEPMHIAQRDENLYGNGRKIVQRQRYSFY